VCWKCCVQFLCSPRGHGQLLLLLITGLLVVLHSLLCLAAFAAVKKVRLQILIKAVVILQCVGEEILGRVNLLSVLSTCAEGSCLPCVGR
jgi:hypothetical protein